MLNPFKKYDVDDFPDVYVPLSNATRHPSVVAEYRRRSSLAATLSGQEPVESKLSDKEDGLGLQKSETVDVGSLNPVFTLEQLRAEVEADVAASGHDTVYDRKAKVINKAIQDIGMGTYQWQLFVLCGRSIVFTSRR